MAAKAGRERDSETEGPVAEQRRCIDLKVVVSVGSVFGSDMERGYKMRDGGLLALNGRTLLLSGHRTRRPRAWNRYAVALI